MIRALVINIYPIIARLTHFSELNYVHSIKNSSKYEQFIFLNMLRFCLCISLERQARVQFTMKS